LFGYPVVAVALGALLGVLLTFVSHRASAYVTPRDPMRGLAVVIAMTGARFALALSALAAYSIFAHDGLAPFGFALGTSFIAGLGFEAVKASRLSASHTSA